jgi:hypothetical protein
MGAGEPCVYSKIVEVLQSARPPTTTTELCGIIGRAMTGEEIELASKAIGESIGALTDASGVLRPVREMADWVTSFIHYRRQPALAKQMMAAARKIRDAGIPIVAVEDKMLRAILEAASLEDDPSMQERWANLLAHACTDETQVPPAFPAILQQLEPIEAQLLDRLVEVRRPMLGHQLTYIEQVAGGEALQWRHLDNLERLQVLGYQWQGPVNVPLPAAPAESPEWTLCLSETTLGSDFVQACAAPAHERPIL